MKLIFFVFSTILFFSCNGQNKQLQIDTKNTDSIMNNNAWPWFAGVSKDSTILHIEYWGIKTDHYAIIPEAVCKKWGFEIWPTWGCEITKEEREKIIKHNIQFNEAMKLKHGNDWKEKFDKEAKNSIDQFLILE